MAPRHVSKLCRLLGRDRLGIPQSIWNECDVYCNVLLKDDRFAFLIVKEENDLQSIIDHNMLRFNHHLGPFIVAMREKIIYQIAHGMNWLHWLKLIMAKEILRVL
jgi:hypothetical protein